MIIPHIINLWGGIVSSDTEGRNPGDRGGRLERGEVDKYYVSN